MTVAAPTRSVSLARRAAVTRPGSWRRPARVLLVGTAVASVLLVVGLWLGNDGLGDCATVAGAAASAGRLAGLVAADLLLVQLLLMARVPWLERCFGPDRLVGCHRWVGVASLTLMLGHVALMVAAGSIRAHAGAVLAAWRMTTTYPGMLMAAVGAAVLVMVAVTSVRAARRRLRYESWHLLHLYAYLGVGLSLPHELWTGTDFLASPLARAYWRSAYLLTAGAVVGYRIGLPVWRSARHRLVVDRVVAEAPGVVSVYLRGRRLDRLPARAGQFFNWRFLDGPGWTRANPYSLSAAVRPDRLRITAKDLGAGSRRLARLQPGTRVLIEGPYGRVTAAARTRRKITMVACGIGITPLRALVEELDYGPGEATLIYRVRTAADVVFRSELDALARTRGVRLEYLVGPRASADSWLPAGAGPDIRTLRRLVPDIADHDVYVCGPDAWTGTVAAVARFLDVPAHRLHVERFTW